MTTLVRLSLVGQRRLLQEFHVIEGSAVATDRLYQALEQRSPDSNLTPTSDAPSNARGRLNSLRQADPHRMAPAADSTEVKYLTLEQMCDRYILRILDHCGGNRLATARALGIGRTSLYRYLKKPGHEARESATRNRLQGY